MAKIEPNLADPAADTQHRTGTTALLLAGLSLATVVRGATWLVSYFLVGPILGFIDLLLPSDYKVLVLEGTLAGLAGLATVIVAVAQRNNPAKYRRAVQVLAWGFAVDVAIYVIPIVALAPFHIHGAFWWTTLTVVTASNLGLLWICLKIIRRTSHQATGHATDPNP